MLVVHLEIKKLLTVLQSSQLDFEGHRVVDTRVDTQQFIISFVLLLPWTKTLSSGAMLQDVRPGISCAFLRPSPPPRPYPRRHSKGDSTVAIKSRSPFVTGEEAPGILTVLGTHILRANVAWDSDA